MHIDAKEILWERYYIPKELEKQVKEKINKGIDLSEILDNLVCFEGIDSEIIYETASYVDPKDNDNKATIEVFENFGDDPIFTNSKNN